jgi:aerobic carbon-monoxide dehydrogenase medium subunit
VKPPRFAYTAPESLDEALDTLVEHEGDTAILAGGQSLMPALNFRLGAPAVIVDINRVAGLGEVSVAGGTIRIGALVRHTELAGSDELGGRCPVFVHAARQIGHAAIRNRGTIGGSLAHGDPAAELPGVVAALGGSVELTSRAGMRAVPFEEFTLGPLMTTKRPDELISAVTVPDGAWDGWGFHEIARRAGDFALAGSVVALQFSGGVVSAARIGLFGVEPVPRRLRDVEDALTGAELHRVAGLAAAAVADEQLDVAASRAGQEDYRRHLAHVAVAKAVSDASRENGEVA